MSQHTGKRLAWALVILWTCFIFSFSMQPLEESSRQSSRMQERLEPVVEAIESALGMDLIPDENLHRVVRKAAHFTLFLILGVLVLRAGRISGWSRQRALRTALLWVILTACMDETLQTFIPGRSGEVRDVIIDTVGGLMGMGMLLLFYQSRGLWREFGRKR